MSKAKDIGTALSARVAEISVANGYLTDSGARVFRGKRRLAETDVPCTTLVEGSDAVVDQTLKLVKLNQRYIFEGHGPCDADNPNDMAHDILADLKRAIFAGADRTLGGLVLKIEYVGRTIGAREDGVDLVFASVEVDVVYTESLQEP